MRGGKGSPFLFVTKSDHGIDTGGLTCRKITSEKYNQTEKRSASKETHEVVRLHAVQQAGKQPRKTYGQGQTNENARDHQLQTMHDEHAEDVLRSRAEGHTDSNLVHALGYGICHDGGNADSGKNQRHEPEHSQENGHIGKPENLV